MVPCSAPTLRQCQPDELTLPLDSRAPPPALSTQDLRSTYWDTQNLTDPLLCPTAPDTTVSFFLGAQEEVTQGDP